jgi:hypothetical protein
VSAAWAAVVVSVVIAAAALARELLRRGERDGKIDACLDQLTQIAADHENRLRLLEMPEAPLRNAPRPRRPPGPATGPAAPAAAR